MLILVEIEAIPLQAWALCPVIGMADSDVCTGRANCSEYLSGGGAGSRPEQHVIHPADFGGTHAETQIPRCSVGPRGCCYWENDEIVECFLFHE